MDQGDIENTPRKNKHQPVSSIPSVSFVVPKIKCADFKIIFWVILLLAILESNGAEVAHDVGIIPPLDHAYRYPGNPVAETTTSSVPELFQAHLKSLHTIDEKVSDRYPALESVAKMETSMGWNPTTSYFNNDSPIKPLLKEGVRVSDSEEICNSFNTRQELLESLLPEGKALHDIMDIVVPSIRDLDFLEQWKPFIENFRIIVIQDGDPDKKLLLPSWANYDLYNRRDIEKALGTNSWIISEKDASIRNFGFLISDKRYVWSVDDDCFPAHYNGADVNVLVEHAINLLTPSTPFFFNTIYDPYRSCSDFVRGYPYSLRGGVQTAVSHGLWMNMYDYDAPTQLLKAKERNSNYHDVTITVPKGVLYPLCSMNVAFDRELLGPALMQGLMGQGQPWGRYDDMFSGWASKVVADHLGVGSKSGAPYIKHVKASNPFTNLAKEYMGVIWQEEVIRFFDQYQFPAAANTASLAYLQLAEDIGKDLAYLSPYFTRLSECMKLWVQAWEDRKAGRLDVKPSRSSRSSPTAPETMSSSPSPTVTLSVTPHPLWKTLFPDIEPPKELKGLPEAAAQMKVYVYELPAEFNAEPLAKKEELRKSHAQLTCKNLYGPCVETAADPLAGWEHMGELSILAKLLLLPRTEDFQEADLFVVPFLGSVTYLAGKDNPLGPRLPEYLKHFHGEYKRRHIILCSSDAYGCQKGLMYPDGPLDGAIWVTEGPKIIYHNPLEFTVPGSHAAFGHNIEPLLNPEHYIYYLANPIYDRYVWETELLALEQHDKKLNIFVRRLNDIGPIDLTAAKITNRAVNYNATYIVQQMKSSLLCPQPTGDLPYAHRLYDTIVSGCVPVVISYPTKAGGVSHFMLRPDEAPVEDFYPFPSLINWGELIVQIDHTEFKEDLLKKVLHKMYLQEMDVLREKRDLVDGMRHLMVYDWSGSGPDAFTALLTEISLLLKSFNR